MPQLYTCEWYDSAPLKRKRLWFMDHVIAQEYGKYCLHMECPCPKPCPNKCTGPYVYTKYCNYESAAYKKACLNMAEWDMVVEHAHAQEIGGKYLEAWLALRDDWLEKAAEWRYRAQHPPPP